MAERTEPKGCVIYGLADPVTGHCRYVGKTSGETHKRRLQHLSEVRRGRVYIPRHKWIASLLAAGLEPEIFEIERTMNWREAEQFWIEHLRAAGCDLLNATAGGDGLASYRHRADTRDRQSKAALARYQRQGERDKTGAAVRVGHALPGVAEKMLGRIVSPETRAKLSASAKVHRNAPEAIAAMSARMTGRLMGPETCAKISAAKRGRQRTRESIEKQVATMTGRKRSPETRAKIAAAARARRVGGEHRLG